jgi:hypothetical protein
VIGVRQTSNDGRLGLRPLAHSERDKLTADGLSPERLKACEAEGRDGTRLPGCASVQRL